jgi:enoyl-CoA hydratase/carnithine racemase
MMPHALLTISQHIARITLHNPPANVLHSTVLHELERCWGEVENNSDVQVVILTGSGRFFCAGADVHELTQLNSIQAGTEFSLRGQALFNRIECSGKPVLAAINGACVGGGLELALACHIRIAAMDALFGLPEVTLGLIPGFGGTQRLPGVVGPSKAAEMILTGQRVTAEEALKIGLVSRIVPSQELLAQAETIASLMTANGIPATQAALQTIRGGREIPWSEGLAREADLFGQLCVTTEKQAATQAFLDRRHSRLAETEA